MGVTVVAWAVFAAVAVAAPRRDKWTAVWWLGAAALAAIPAIRAAAWVAWPSFAAAVALASLAAGGGRGWRQVALGLIRVGRLPQGALAMAGPATRVRPSRGWRPALTGVGLGAVLLGVFVPLFATADAAFAHLLSEAVPDAEVDDPVLRAAAAFGIAAGGGALLLAAIHGPVAAGRPAQARLSRMEWAPALTALVALFAAFVALQLTTLYGDHDHVLRTAGLTYAEYAREGFAQLIAAAALTLAVIAAAARWADPGKGRLLHALLGALCVLTLAILASALTRLGLYEEAYGFTRLRFAAHAAILWLAGIFVLLLVAGALRRTGHLPRATVALSGAAVLAFALADPDRRIAAHNVDRYERIGRIDAEFLATLSADAAPALTELPPRMAARTTRHMRRDLAGGDAIAALNLGRARAREALGP